MKRTTCGGCGYDDLRLFLDLGVSPVADAYTSTAAEVSPTYPLQLAVCTGCWLVQLLEVVDQEILFGTGYSFYSSASPPLSRYHEQYADDVLTAMGDPDGKLVVEIGCNDGDMLRHFQSAGCKAIGVDPSGGPVKVARERGLPVWNIPFDVKVGQDLRATMGPVDVAIANHVLAHVENVSSVLAGVSMMLAPDGVAMIEVQYLPDLLVNNAFDLVYHEHRNFFSLSSLEKAAQRHGLFVTHAELTNRQGGSLRVTLSRTRQDSRKLDSFRASETWLRGLSAYEGMQGRAERVRHRLRESIAEALGNGERVAGYGAPAKATTLLNFCGIGVDQLEFIVDSTEAKQGRYVPGTGIPILPPGLPRDPDVFVLLSWNYARQIVRNSRGFQGRWILPIPSPMEI